VAIVRILGGHCGTRFEWLLSGYGVAIKGLLSGSCEDIGWLLQGSLLMWLLSGYGVAIKGLLSGYCEDIGRLLWGSLLSGY